MKLKYYMRGLGIGIVVTALLMGYSNRTHATIQQAQKEIESEADAQDSSLLTLRQQNDALLQENEEKESATAQENSTDEQSITETDGIPDGDNRTEETEVISETEDDEHENAAASLKDGDKVTITVNTGEGSGTVARKLENAGVIDNAKEFDAYLMQHGYDKSISRGDHEVIIGSSWMDIAKQMTSK